VLAVAVSACVTPRASPPEVGVPGRGLLEQARLEPEASAPSERAQSPSPKPSFCESKDFKARPLPPLPSGANSGQSVFQGAVGDRVVVLWLDGKRVKGVVYDPDADRWEWLPDWGAPQMRGYSFGGPRAYGSHLFVAGFHPELLVLDPVGKRWVDIREGAPTSQNTWEIVASKDAWFVWTWNDDGMLHYDQGLRLDLRSGRWTPMAPKDAPEPRFGAAVTRCADAVFVWGGWTLTSPMDDQGNASFEPRDDGAVYDIAKGTWRPITRAGAPTGRGEPFAGCSGRKVMLFGGSAATSTRERDTNEHTARDRNDGALYDVEQDRWTLLRQPGGPFAMSGLRPSAAMRPAFHVVGRRLVFFYHLNDVVFSGSVLDPEADAWAELPWPPFPAHLWDGTPVDDRTMLFFDASLSGALDVERRQYCGPGGAWLPSRTTNPSPAEPTLEPAMPGGPPPGIPGGPPPGIPGGPTGPGGGIPGVPVRSVTRPPVAILARDRSVVIWGVPVMISDCNPCPPGASCLPCRMSGGVETDGQVLTW